MLRQGTSPINSPLGWLPVQDTHEIAVTADKSREHPPSTVCHIVLPAHHIPAIPRSSAYRHQLQVTYVTLMSPESDSTTHSEPRRLGLLTRLPPTVATTPKTPKTLVSTQIRAVISSDLRKTVPQPRKATPSLHRQKTVATSNAGPTSKIPQRRHSKLKAQQRIHLPNRQVLAFGGPSKRFEKTDIQWIAPIKPVNFSKFTNVIAKTF